MGHFMVCNESGLQWTEARLGQVGAEEYGPLPSPVLRRPSHTHSFAPHTLTTLFVSPESGQDVQVIVKMSQKTGLNRDVAAAV